MRARLIAALGLALLLSSTSASAIWAGGDQADLCLEVASGALPQGAWAQVVERVTEVLASRAELFPAPSLRAVPAPEEPLSGQTPARLDVESGHAGEGAPMVPAPCLEPGADWTARFGRAFLEASADRMLEDAPTTPGIASDVTIEWHPDETRVRTVLTFAGPLDIPNGRCWVDDILSVDAGAGVVLASGEQGLETSPFAESACGRFFGYLPDGGAGEQVVTLLPAEIVLDDGATLRFVATAVNVLDEAVVIRGQLETR